MKVCACLIPLMLANVMFYNLSSCTSTELPDPRLVNFLRLICSNFSDRQEVSADLQNNVTQVHNLLYASFIPVKVPRFTSSITLLLKEFAVNKLQRLMILNTFLDSDRVIRMKQYQVPNMEKYTFETPESEIIAGLKEGELKAERTECDPTYVEIEPNVFFGTFPDCLDFPNTKYPQSFSSLVTCNALSGFAPYKSKEGSTARAYRLSVTNRYSLSPFSDLLGDISHLKDPCTCP